VRVSRRKQKTSEMKLWHKPQQLAASDNIGPAPSAGLLF
jgi:hypothetical protein